MTVRKRRFLRFVFWVNLSIACLCMAHYMDSGRPDLVWLLFGHLWVGYRVDSWLNPPS
jgi:hypothetical protein